MYNFCKSQNETADYEFSYPLRWHFKWNCFCKQAFSNQKEAVEIQNDQFTPFKMLCGKLRSETEVLEKLSAAKFRVELDGVVKTVEKWRKIDGKG